MHRRKRPPLVDSAEIDSSSRGAKVNSTESVDPLWEKFLNELGIKNKQQKNENKDKTLLDSVEDKTVPLSHPLMKSTVSISAISTKIPTTTTVTTATTTTTTTTSTTPSSTTQITDAPDLYTDDLVAYAGSDIHVYYPSNVCVLNGTLTRYYTSSSTKKIVKWLWTKMDSSPAFGVK